MFKTIGDTGRIIKNGLKDVVILDLLYKVAGLCFLYPLFMFVLENLLKSCGLTYINAYNIIKIFKKPIVILAIVIMLLVMSFGIIVKIISLMLTFDHNNTKGKLFNIIKIDKEKNNQEEIDKEEKISIFRIIFIALKKSINLCKIKDVKFIIIFIAMIPLSTSHIMNRIVEKFSLADLSTDYVFGKLYIAIISSIVILILLLYARKQIFILYIHLITKEKYNENKIIYNKIKNKSKASNFFDMCVINVITTVLLLALYVVGAAIIAFIIKVISTSKLELVVFLEILDIFDDAFIYFALVIFIMVNVAHIYVLIYNFFSLNENNVENTYVNENDKLIIKSYVTKKKKYSAVFVVFLCLFIATVYLIDRYSNGQLYIEKSMELMKVTSHRGYSAEAPENTIPAIQKAIENKADYVEIDVQLTKDGEIVVFHDSNIKRITGVDKNLSDVTYEELSKLDAGEWFSDKYKGITVPTLREVLDYTKGKIELNIELKNAPEDGKLSEEVAKLIEEYKFERQCVVTSFEYSELVNIKKYNNEIKTGYIMRYIYNDCFSDENIDALSIKKTYVNANILKRAHKNGKEVFVWTVDDYDEMVKLNEIGADNIITDDPVLGKRAVYSVGERKLLKYVFDYDKYFDKESIY